MDKKILIVEDEKPLARALELKLQSSGFTTVVVFDGEAALAALQDGNTSLILLDLILPKLDGFGLLAKLKEQGIKIPVIVLSNLGQQEDINKAKTLGAIDYFVKSDTTLVSLIEQVKRILSQT